MIFNKKPKIEFYTHFEELAKNKDLLPYSGEKYKPSWWKDMPSYVQETDMPTIKKCPGVPDFFNQGYIVPMWMDVKYEKVNNPYLNPFIQNKYGLDLPDFTVHPDDMFNKHIPEYSIGDRKIDATIKANSPWNVITPKGWSILVLPLFYEFTPDYTLLPGVMDTDIFHQTNHAMIVHSNKKPIEIKRGTPFVMYVPFKRTKNNFKVITDNIKKYNQVEKVDKKFYELQAKGNAYRKMQRERDNK